MTTRPDDSESFRHLGNITDQEKNFIRSYRHHSQQATQKPYWEREGFGCSEAWRPYYDHQNSPFWKAFYESNSERR
jgi:hypothetical protein